MLDPKVLCDTFTLIREPDFDPDSPFDDVFNPDDPFGEPVVFEDIILGDDSAIVGTPFSLLGIGPLDERVYTVLSRVRLSQSSGDRAVDAQGDKDARQAILFFFKGVSRADGKLDIPAIKEGDKLAEGALTALPTDTKIWTVKGVKPLKSRDRLHHLEVSLV